MKVIKIPATGNPGPGSPASDSQSSEKLRVAAYCRVSTNLDAFCAAERTLVRLPADTRRS